jgi:hypothetical protein
MRRGEQGVPPAEMTASASGPARSGGLTARPRPPRIGMKIDATRLAHVERELAVLKGMAAVNLALT